MTCLTHREYGALFAHASALSALHVIRTRVQRDIDDAELIKLWIGILSAAIEARSEESHHA